MMSAMTLEKIRGIEAMPESSADMPFTAWK
jgi:hypothetical protein